MFKTNFVFIIGFFLLATNVNSRTLSNDCKNRAFPQGNFSTPLGKAINDCNLTKVKELVTNKATAGQLVMNDFPAVVFASWRGAAEITRYLISKGANVNAAEVGRRSGNTALYYAAATTNLTMVELLLKAGADVNPTGGSPLYAAVRTDSGQYPDVVSALIKAGANVKACRECLPEAGRLGYGDIIQLLLKAGLKVDAKNQNGDTALMAACREDIRPHRVIPLLVARKASLTQTDKYNRTPLLLFSSRAKSRGEFKNEMTGAQYDKVWPLLIKSPASFGQKDRQKNTMLHYAARSNRTNIGERILKQKVDINAQNRSGETALIVAAQYGNVEFVEFLLKAKANTTIKDETGKTAAGHAVGFWDKKVRARLLKVLGK